MRAGARTAFAMLVAVALAPWAAHAQSAGARAGAAVDLSARLAEVQADPAATERLLKVGRKVAAFCANCHGEGGTSVKPEVPNLAAQSRSYLVEQLRQFADGRRREPFMEGMIRAMSPDEKIGMVLFYSGQPLGHRAVVDPALATQGRSYYGRACLSCHGPAGLATSGVPRIAGQQPVYLATTLRRYRDGSHERASPQMSAGTRDMTDGDIAAVAAYVASMH